MKECFIPVISVNSLPLQQVIWGNIRNKHEGVKYPCDKCEYSATTASNLKVHIENKLQGVRYPCDQCEYTATTKSAHNHEWVRYPCDQCDYSASSTRNIKKHIKINTRELDISVTNVNMQLLKWLIYGDILKKCRLLSRWKAGRPICVQYTL